MNLLQSLKLKIIFAEKHNRMKENGLTVTRCMGILVNAGLIVLTVMSVLKCCFVSFDIDEAYAIAQSYRLAVGDHMFSQMWEPHQMSSFGAALFIVPFLWITKGSTEGIVLYLRVVGTILHLLIGLAYFRTAQKRLGSQSALFVALLHINFLPKWIVMPEFEIMQYWAVSVLFLSFLCWEERREENRGTGWLFPAGIALFVCLMTYPTMLLLYPVYVFALYKLSPAKPKGRWKEIAMFTLGPLSLGILFLAYLFSYMTIPEFLENIKYLFLDSSHSVKLSDRLYSYLKEIVSFMGQLLLPLLGVTAVTFALKKKGVLKKNGWQAYCLWGMLLLLGFFAGKHIMISVFGDKNQFYLYFRFALVVLCGLILSSLHRKKRSVYVLAGILPAVAGVIASALVTNMSLEIAMARIYVGVIATFFLMKELLAEHFQEDKVIRATGYVVSVLFLGGLLVSKLILMRITGCIPVTICAEMEWVTKGPAKGLYLKSDLAQQYMENHEVIENYVQEGDRLLYFGCENLYYLSAKEVVFATPSVQGTAVFNEMYLLYYELHPDRMPNVVIIDKVFRMNPYYRYSEENQIVLDWIGETFADAEVVETNHFTVLRNQ